MAVVVALYFVCQLFTDKLTILAEEDGYSLLMMKVAHFCDHRDDDDDSFLLMMMKTTTTKMKKKEEEEDKKKNMNVMAIDNEAGENLFIQAFGDGGMD